MGGSRRRRRSRDCGSRSCESFNKVLYLKSFCRFGFGLLCVPISTTAAADTPRFFANLQSN